MKYFSIFISIVILLSGCSTDALPSQASSQASNQLDEGIYVKNPYLIIQPQWLYNPDDSGAASGIYTSISKLGSMGLTAATAQEVYSHLPLDHLTYLEMRSTAPETPEGDYIHIYPSDLSFALWLDKDAQEAILQVGSEEYHVYELSNESFDAIAEQLNQQISLGQRLPPVPLNPESASSAPAKKNPSP